MTDTYEIVRVKPEHVEQVLADVRHADVLEFSATGDTPREVLDRSLRLSHWSWAGLRNGEAVCIFGVASDSLLSATGAPWMVGTSKLHRCAKAFLPRSRMVVKHLMQMFDLLENFVDARNTRAVKWLRWLGFTIHEAQAYGNKCEPFHKFSMRRF